jgi:enamine deaminase RidA (YjgF/YER057c/UK114 family)
LNSVIRQLKVLAIAAIVVLGVSSCGTRAGDIEYYRRPQSKLPFSEAVRAGDFLFVSGQIGSATGSGPAAPFSAAARDALDHISGVLISNGSNMDHVVQCTVMLADMRMWPAFNEVYVTYFKPGHLPARSAFGANGLANGAPLEVSCFAYEPASKR